MTPGQFAKREQQRFLDDLKTFVRFPSVSAQPQHKRDLQACAQWLVRHLRDIGLTTKLYPTKGHPVIVARTPHVAGKATVLVYGHYDVQPPEPLHLWKTPPFEPVVQSGKLFGRGASDNKGQIFVHVKAVESYLATGTALPVNVIFLIEGEEEVGSNNLIPFLKQHGRELRADYVVVSDSGMWAKGVPAVTYGTRGVLAMELRVDGPNRDLHSGVFGGSVANPAMVLAQLLASCVDANGHITVPGFYDAVTPLTKWERRQFAKLPFDERAYAKSLGVPATTGEKGFTTTERRWARPTLEINGIFGGYQGAGGKTIVPAWAGAKITCRLVPDQKATTIARLVQRHLRAQCPKSAKLTVEVENGSEAFLQSPRSPATQAAARAAGKAFDCDPVFIREGGSLPILPLLQKTLGAEVLLLGLGLADDNWHSPNEKFDLENYRRGTAMSIGLLAELGSLR
jgi:acetylornithine deacetylase/succinyl-diaminopimelate desuccinylase-like protein